MIEAILFLRHLFPSSSSSCRATSTDLPDPFPAAFSIVQCFRPVFKASSCIGTEQLYVGSRLSSCLCPSMRRGPQEYVTYEFVPISPAVSRMSNLVFMIGGWWLYSNSFVGCCLQDLFNITRTISVKLLSSFFSIRLVNFHVVNLYNGIDATAASKKLHFSLSVRSNFHMTDDKRSIKYFRTIISHPKLLPP